MKQIEMGPIETHEELVAWLRTEIAAGHVDIDVPIRHMRILRDIVDALTDADVEAAITEAFRSVEGPNVVLTLCNGTVVAEAGLYGDTTVDDAIYDLECALSRTYSGDVTLAKAKPDAEGYGVVVAYRMPPRYHQPYQAGDASLVDRFGVEVGRYRQRAA